MNNILSVDGQSNNNINSILLIVVLCSSPSVWMSDMTPYESCVSPACGVVWPAKDVSQHTNQQ